MSADQVDIKVSPDLIRGIIETKVQAAITDALLPEGEVVTKLVAAALTQKVSAQGKVTGRDYEDKYTYLDYLCRDVIQKAAAAAIANWAKERHTVIEAEFRRQLQTKKTS